MTGHRRPEPGGSGCQHHTDGSDPEAAAADVATLVTAPERAAAEGSPPTSGARRPRLPAVRFVSRLPEGGRFRSLRRVAPTRRSRRPDQRSLQPPPQGAIAFACLPLSSSTRRPCSGGDLWPDVRLPSRRTTPCCRAVVRLRDAAPRGRVLGPARRPTPWCWSENRRRVPSPKAGSAKPVRGPSPRPQPEGQFSEASPWSVAASPTRRSVQRSRPVGRRRVCDPEAASAKATRELTPQLRSEDRR